MTTYYGVSPSTVNTSTITVGTSTIVNSGTFSMDTEFKIDQKTNKQIELEVLLDLAETSKHPMVKKALKKLLFTIRAVHREEASEKIEERIKLRDMPVWGNTDTWPNDPGQVITIPTSIDTYTSTSAINITTDSTWIISDGTV